MKLKASKYIISLFFVALLLFKGAVCVAMVFSSHFKVPVTELLADCSQESKGASKSETAVDEELFGKALLPEDHLLLIVTTPKQTTDIAESLKDVYLDTLTPPPLV